MQTATEIRAPFTQIIGQPVASAYLSAALDSDSFGSAYLFTGPLGSGKTKAALLLAQVLLCRNKGDDNCIDCRQTAEQAHPDLGILSPEGAGGYLMEQIHELIHDSTLAPMQSVHKVYIISQADTMSTSFANAFLKTLEEPPPNVTFILIARNSDSIIPTVRSRCQVIPFTPIPEATAIRMLTAEIKTTDAEARIALANSAGSIEDAIVFLRSSSMKTLRKDLMTCLKGLTRYDALDVMEAAKSLVVSCRLPLDELKASQDRRLEEGKEVLSRSALSSLEQRLKREMTAAERTSVLWVIRSLRVWLRDIMLVVSNRPDLVRNSDEIDLIRAYAASVTGIESVMTCLQATLKAEQSLDYNVSVQSVFEYLLFTLRDELEER